MTFHATEVSESSGRPVYLVKFMRSGKSWFYNNSEIDITFLGDVYLAEHLVIPDILQSGTSDEDSITIGISRFVDLSEYLDLYSTSAQISVYIRKIHVEEDASTGAFTTPVLAADAPIVWIGSIGGVSRPSPILRELICSQLRLGRGGLRLTWSRGCPHMLYSQGDGMCNVNKASHAVPVATLSVVNGTDVSASEFSALESGWLDGGFLEWEVEPGVVERRGIESHSGATVKMFGTTEGMGTATSVVAYPGCNRTPIHCHTKFGNMTNYGGINHLQGKSPFDGTGVFY